MQVKFDKVKLDVGEAEYSRYDVFFIVMLAVLLSMKSAVLAAKQSWRGRQHVGICSYSMAPIKRDLH